MNVVWVNPWVGLGLPSGSGCLLSHGLGPIFVLKLIYRKNREMGDFNNCVATGVTGQ